MAKTKRRQLAALAAQAELKELNSQNGRTSSGDRLGPSGISRFKQVLLDDPMVEIRTQRIVFKIPALPSKPAPDAPQSPTIAKMETSRKRTRKYTPKDMDFRSDQVPADEAKISKTILQLGKWKRQKRLRDLIPALAKVAASTELPNRDHKSSAAETVVSNQHSNGQSHLSLAKARPRRQSKASVNLMSGSREPEKLQEGPVRLSAEQETKALETQCRPKETMECTMPRDHSSRDLLFAETSRSQELGKACNGDVAGTTAHPQVSRKRRRGKSTKLIQQVPVSSKAAVVLQPKTRKRAQKANSEAVAVTRRRAGKTNSEVIPVTRRRGKKANSEAIDVTRRAEKAKSEAIAETKGAEKANSEAIGCEGLQETQHEKNITQKSEEFGRSMKEDRTLVRSAADGEAANTSRDQSHTGQISARIPTSPIVQEAELLGNGRLTGNSSSHNLVQNNRHASHQIYAEGVSQEDRTPRPQSESFDPGEQVMLLDVADRNMDLGQSAYSSGGKKTVLSGAELIKQESQLAIMKKRLEAAGGLRNWLVERGLGQIVPILEKWNLDHLSLLQLTMEGLKGMGLLQVGPRRKLIHAVSSLTVPSFSNAPFIHTRH